MHLLAYWRLDNYLRDLDEGAGFNFNSRQARLHTAIELGETLWLFTAIKNPPRFFIVATLVASSKTMNPAGFKYGDFRVWGDLERSRYFKLRVDQPGTRHSSCFGDFHWSPAAYRTPRGSVCRRHVKPFVA